MYFPLGVFWKGLPRWLSGKEPTCQCRRQRFDPWVRKIPLEKEMATHSSILAWKIPWTEDPGGLQSMDPQRVQHDWATEHAYFGKSRRFTLMGRLWLSWCVFRTRGNELKWQKFPVFQQTSKALLSQASWQLFKTPCCHTYSKPVVNSPSTSVIKKVLVTQSCLTLCDPVDSSLAGSSVHGIFQAKILQWVAIPFSWGSSQLRDQTWIPHIASRFFTIWATRKPNKIKHYSKKSQW